MKDVLSLSKKIGLRSQIVNKQLTQKRHSDCLCKFLIKSTGDSSVGRAVDCRSIGRVFDSLSPDLNLRAKVLL